MERHQGGSNGLQWGSREGCRACYARRKNLRGLSTDHPRQKTPPGERHQGKKKKQKKKKSTTETSSHARTDAQAHGHGALITLLRPSASASSSPLQAMHGHTDTEFAINAPPEFFLFYFSGETLLRMWVAHREPHDGVSGPIGSATGLGAMTAGLSGAALPYYYTIILYFKTICLYYYIHDGVSGAAGSATCLGTALAESGAKLPYYYTILLYYTTITATRRCQRSRRVDHVPRHSQRVLL